MEACHGNLSMALCVPRLATLPYLVTDDPVVLMQVEE